MRCVFSVVHILWFDSSLYLEEHSPAQVAVGVIAGLVYGGFLYWFNEEVNPSYYCYPCSTAENIIVSLLPFPPFLGLSLRYYLCIISM